MGVFYSFRSKGCFLSVKYYGGPILLMFSLSTIACTYSLKDKKERENSMKDLKVDIGKPAIPTNMQLSQLHTIEDIVLLNPDFGGVKRLLLEHGAMEYLKKLGPVTLLLPVGAELDSCSRKFLEGEIKGKGSTALLDILRAHSLERPLDRADLITAMANNGSFTLGTLNKDSLRFRMESKQLYVETKDGLRSRIVIMDQGVRDGTIYGIEHWLIPTKNVLK